MDYTLVTDLYKNKDSFQNKDIKLGGWVRTLRSSNAFGFIELNDGTFFKNIQIVFDNKLNNFEEIAKTTIGSSIIVEGTFILTENAKHQYKKRTRALNF